MKSTSNESPLTVLLHSGQEAVNSLGGHLRTTADKSRRLISTRHKSELLRNLGQLHYEAGRTGAAPDQEVVARLIGELREMDAVEEPEGPETDD